MATIHEMPASSTQPPEASAPIALPGPWARKNTYCPATWARLAMTSTSEATIAQPPAQPVLGPNARAAQMNVVPQSGSALFSSLKPIEHSSIGTNASRATSGDFSPTAATTKKRVAARLYAGAVEATPMATLDARPRAPGLRPLLLDCSTGCTPRLGRAMARLPVGHRSGTPSPGRAQTRRLGGTAISQAAVTATGQMVSRRPGDTQAEAWHAGAPSV